jgi:hypothetical protein
MAGWMDGCMDGWMDGWVNVCVGGWLDGWMDVWMNLTCVVSTLSLFEHSKLKCNMYICMLSFQQLHQDQCPSCVKQLHAFRSVHTPFHFLLLGSALLWFPMDPTNENLYLCTLCSSKA